MNLAHYYSSEYSHGHGDYWLGVLLALVFIALLVTLIAVLLRGVGTGQALDEAKRRYARGEITKKQLDEIKKELKK